MFTKPHPPQHAVRRTSKFSDDLAENFPKRVEALSLDDTMPQLTGLAFHVVREPSIVSNTVGSRFQ